MRPSGGSLRTFFFLFLCVRLTFAAALLDSADCAASVRKSTYLRGYLHRKYSIAGKKRKISIPFLHLSTFYSPVQRSRHGCSDIQEGRGLKLTVWSNCPQQRGRGAALLPLIPFCPGNCNVQRERRVGEDKEASTEADISADLSGVMLTGKSQ